MSSRRLLDLAESISTPGTAPGTTQAPPSLMVECCGASPLMSSYDAYQRQTPKEQIRQAVYMLRDAIRSAAYDGIQDDGRNFRRTKEGEDDPWAAVDRMISTKLPSVNSLEAIIAEAKAVLDSFKE